MCVVKLYSVQEPLRKTNTACTPNKCLFEIKTAGRCFGFDNDLQGEQEHVLVRGASWSVELGGGIFTASVAPIKGYAPPVCQGRRPTATRLWQAAALHNRAHLENTESSVFGSTSLQRRFQHLRRPPPFFSLLGPEKTQRETTELHTQPPTRTHLNTQRLKV